MCIDSTLLGEHQSQGRERNRKKWTRKNTFLPNYASGTCSCYQNADVLECQQNCTAPFTTTEMRRYWACPGGSSIATLRILFFKVFPLMLTFHDSIYSRTIGDYNLGLLSSRSQGGSQLFGIVLHGFLQRRKQKLASGQCLPCFLFGGRVPRSKEMEWRDVFHVRRRVEWKRADARLPQPAVGSHEPSGKIWKNKWPSSAPWGAGPQALRLQVFSRVPAPNVHGCSRGRGLKGASNWDTGVLEWPLGSRLAESFRWGFSA